MKKGIWSIVVYDKACFICKLPIKIIKLAPPGGGKAIDRNNYIHHSTQEPSIQWRDGNNQGMYHLYNINFEYELWQKAVKRELSATEILQLKNIEQRTAVLRLYGGNFILQSFKHKLLDKDRGGVKLYEIKIDDRTTWKLLKYKDTSSDRIYHSLVPPDTNTVLEALAWKFQVDKEDYKRLEIES